jgi:membrane-bound metal-dependent hydrolase YbcI (DUF457 family)
MLIGHYAVSMAARAAEPRTPLWVYVAAAQWLDIVWCVLVMLGIETYRPAPELPGSTLDFTSYPYTHSLVAAVLWGLSASLLTVSVVRSSRREAIAVGVVVFSHWVLDLLVHRPDLPLWPGGAKVGLGLWNTPGLERGLEIALVAAGAAWWALVRRREGRSAWPPMLFAATLISLFLAAGSGGDASDPVAVGLTGLGFYMAVVGAAWLLDRQWRRSAAP